MASSSQSLGIQRKLVARFGAVAARRRGERGVNRDPIDIIQRLGLVDMAVNRLRARIEATDIDSAIDDAIDYLRRNPEMIVVALGTLTVAVGAVVFLAAPDEERRPARSARTSREDRSESNRDDIDITPSLATPRASTTRSRSTSSGSGASSSRRNSTRE